MKLVIDRFEGNYAVCEKEDGLMVDVERNKIPVVAKEGDVLVLEFDVYTIDRKQTDSRKDKINKLINELWE